MWRVYKDAEETPLPQAALVFDRFHLTQQLSRAVDDVRRQAWRQLPGAEKADFKRTRFLWLKNPENLAQTNARGCRRCCGSTTRSSRRTSSRRISAASGRIAARRPPAPIPCSAS